MEQTQSSTKIMRIQQRNSRTHVALLQKEYWLGWLTHFHVFAEFMDNVDQLWRTYISLKFASLYGVHSLHMLRFPFSYSYWYNKEKSQKLANNRPTIHRVPKSDIRQQRMAKNNKYFSQWNWTRTWCRPIVFNRKHLYFFDLHVPLSWVSPDWSVLAIYFDCTLLINSQLRFVHAGCVARGQWRIQGRGDKGLWPTYTHEKLCNHYGIVAENSVKYVTPDSFFGIQILLISIAAGAPESGGVYDAPSDPLVVWGGRYPSPFPTLDALGISLRLDAFRTEKRTLEMPPP